MKTITSPDNFEIKESKKLHDAKYRKETGLFFFEGKHLFEEYLKSGKKPYRVFVTENVSNLCSDCEEKRVITPKLYDKITAENAPQGIFTVAEISSVDVIHSSPEEIFPHITKGAVVLESMRDPGNVGTVIRTSVSLGVPIIFTEDCADIFNPKTIRASMGAIFSDKIYITPSATKFAEAAVKNGFNVFGAILDHKAKEIGKFPIKDKSVFIIGNEGSGLKPDTLNACNESAYIPMTGKTESLNAAIAASIIIWEISKTIGSV